MTWEQYQDYDPAEWPEVHEPPRAPRLLEHPPQLGHELALYRTDGMTREEWLQARRALRTIGASDVAGILQASPYSSPLQVWAGVTGRHEHTVEEHELDRMLLGNACEPEVRVVAASRLGVGLCSIETGAELVHRGISFLSPFPFVVQHPRHRCLTASLDAIACVGGELCVVELKTAGWRQRDGWDSYRMHGTIDSIVGTALLAYYTQVQAQLAVTGLRRGYLVGVVGEEAAAWMLTTILMRRREGEDAKPLQLRDGDVYVFQIERDEEVIEVIETVVPRFHARHIERDEMPTAIDKRNELEALRELWLLEHPDLRPRVDAVGEAARRYAEVTSQITQLEKARGGEKIALQEQLTKLKVDSLLARDAEGTDWLIEYRANRYGSRSMTVRKAKE